MLKITSTVREYEDAVDFEIEDQTEDFDELGMELAALIRYAYDAMAEAAGNEGVPDPRRQAQVYIDSIVNDAINGDLTEGGPMQEAPARKGEILRLVDDFIERKKREDD